MFSALACNDREEINRECGRSSSARAVFEDDLMEGRDDSRGDGGGDEGVIVRDRDESFKGGRVLRETEPLEEERQATRGLGRVV